MMNRNNGIPACGSRAHGRCGGTSYTPSPTCSCGGGTQTAPSRSAPRSPQNGGCGCAPTRSRPLPAQSRGDCREGGCGCEQDRCARLLAQIRAVDFALWETVLYLDVYPHSCDALESYHKLKAQSAVLRREYESACGPLTATGNQSATSWDWFGKPFPWEYGAD